MRRTKKKMMYGIAAAAIAAVSSLFSCEGNNDIQALFGDIIYKVGSFTDKVVNDSALSGDSSDNSSTATLDYSGESYELVASPSGLPEQILKRTAYTVSYNKDRRNPNWVAWHLTRDHAYGEHKRDGIAFKEDDSVPFPKATNADYKKTGFERGHMCPSADNRWSAVAQEESFLFTNMCPQTHACNAGDWEEIEAACRRWAKKYGDVWIACGPIYEGGSRQRTIGKSKVAVPEKFFKVVLTKTFKGWEAVGFIVPNLPKMNHPVSSYAMTVSAVEQKTGYDFFSSLPDDIEQAVESSVTKNVWFYD